MMIKFISKAFGGKKKKKKTVPKLKAKAAEPTITDQPTDQTDDQSGTQPIAVAEVKSAPKKTPEKTPNKTPNKTVGKSPSHERDELIQNALAIHREKSKLLDNLPPAVRTKLTAMAMAIYIKQRSDNKKN